MKEWLLFHDTRTSQLRKKVFNVPNPSGICVADNGIFAVMFHVKNGFFHLYYSCGKLMKVVRLPPGYGRMVDCTFSGSDLYLTDHGGRKIYKYTPNGKFLKVIASGEHFLFITSCHNRLFVTTETRRLISYHNDREVYRVTVPGRARGVVIDLNNRLHVSLFNNKVLIYSLEGKRIGETVYKDLRAGDGMIMDPIGNTLITDRRNPSRLLVYSPCGELIKTIRTAGYREPVDVDIGNDGTIIVADWPGNKLYLY